MIALFRNVTVATLALTILAAPLAADAAQWGSRGGWHGGSGGHAAPGYGGGWHAAPAYGGGWHTAPAYGGGWRRYPVGWRGGPSYGYGGWYGPRPVSYGYVNGFYGYAPLGFYGYYYNGGWYHHRRWSGGVWIYF